MEMDAIVTLITGVGFPIAMCVLLFMYMEDEKKNHKEEIKGLQEVLTDLKISITQLIDKIGGKKE